MAILYRKLFRDVKTSKWQFSAVVLLAVIGIVFFVSLYSSFQNLWKSINDPYGTLNFADFTVKVYGAPADITEEIQTIDGVKVVIGRISIEVPMTMANMENELLTGRIITLPSNSRMMVNDVYIVEGSYFSSNSERETLLEKSFANYHGLKVGDNIRIVYGGNQSEFVVRGIAVSPEYLWPARNVRDHMPTVLRNWGVLFLSEDEARRIFNFDDRINEVAVLLTNQDLRDDVVDKVKTILAPYGLAEVTIRDNQASDKILRLMIGSLDILAPVLSGFFLTVAGTTIYVLLARMVSTQGIQIGTMRALGYGKRSILLYYLSFAFLVWLTSSVIGVIFGHLLSLYLVNLFARWISLPIVLIEPQWTTYASGSALALIFLVFAGIFPAWKAANLKPAEAMRPPAPRLGRVIRMDNAFFFLSHASSSVKIPLRNMFRSKQRSLSMVLGIMLATSVVVSTHSFLDSFDYLFKVMYNDIAVYDIKVTFISPQNPNVIDVSRDIPSVVAVEPILEIPYHVRRDGKEYLVTITGLNPNATLYRLYTPSGAPTPIDIDEILLSRTFKDKLGADVGDRLELHFFNFTSYVRVSGFVNSPFGDSAYLSLKKSQEVLGARDFIGGLLVKAESSALETVRKELFRLPNVSSIETVTQQRQDNMEMLKLFSGFIWTIFAFGILMAFAVVFNTVSLNILERSRELATLRTLGMTMRRIAGMVTLENTLLGLVGILFGLPSGNYLARYFISFFSSDLFFFEAVTYVSTYVLGIVIILMVLLVSSLPGLRHVRRLELAQIVKEQSN